MNIDVTALQMLPAIDTSPTGLRPRCKPRTIVCVKPSCKVTIIVVSLGED